MGSWLPRLHRATGRGDSARTVGQVAGYALVTPEPDLAVVRRALGAADGGEGSHGSIAIAGTTTYGNTPAGIAALQSILAEWSSSHTLAVKQANISGGHQQVNNGVQPAQQAGSAQGGGGVESLPAPETGTARYPTQGFFPPGAEIQTEGSAAQAA